MRFKRGRGYPHTNWRSTVNKDLLRMGITWEEAQVAFHNRFEWCKRVAQCIQDGLIQGHGQHIIVECTQFQNQFQCCCTTRILQINEHCYCIALFSNKSKTTDRLYRLKLCKPITNVHVPLQAPWRQLTGSCVFYLNQQPSHQSQLQTWTYNYKLSTRSSYGKWKSILHILYYYMHAHAQKLLITITFISSDNLPHIFS